MSLLALEKEDLPLPRALGDADLSEGSQALRADSLEKIDARELLDDRHAPSLAETDARRQGERRGRRIARGRASWLSWYR